MIEGPAYGVVLAAGRSERMDGIDKVYATLLGRPLLAWTLRAFKLCEAIDGVLLVVRGDAFARAADFVREWRFQEMVEIVAGGERRQDSARAGVEAATPAAIVAVHDGARPLVTPEIIARGVALAREGGAAMCGVPARDTVKQVAGDPPVVGATLARDGVWLAQTPQVFERDLLLRAYTSSDADVTDDAALVEALGHAVRVYEGSPSNLKITGPDDLVLAEALLRERFDAQAGR